MTDGTAAATITTGNFITANCAKHLKVIIAALALLVTPQAFADWTAVGSQGKIIHSVDGITWQEASSGTDKDLRGVATDDAGNWVASGGNGLILSSSDGTTWQPQFTGNEDTLWESSYGGGQWLTVGFYATVLTSPDSSNWSLQNSGFFITFFDVAYDGIGHYVIAGDTGLSGSFWDSTNGTTWNQHPSGTPEGLYGIDYGVNTWVAVGDLGTIQTTGAPASGVWTSQDSGTNEGLRDVIFNGSGLFVAVGLGGTILTSTNGINWTTAASGTSNDLYGIDFDGSLYVAVGSGGIILTSSDAVNWSTATSPVGFRLYSVAAGRVFATGIDVVKTADQNAVAAPSAAVTFSVTTTNTSERDDIALTNLIDDQFGELSLKGCDLPQTLAAGMSYTCSFTETISGSVGDQHMNTVQATAYDEAQQELTASNSATVDFIDPNNGAIGRFVWNDRNADGIYQPGEPLLNGVTMALGGDASQTTTTGLGGFYSFSNLSAGNYTVTVTDDSNLLSGMQLTTANQPYNRTLAAGEIEPSANFGYAGASLQVFKEAFPSVVLDTGASVTFELLVQNNGPFNVTVTSLNDDVYGNLNGQGSCITGASVAPGANYSCQFSKVVSGTPGEVHTNIISVTAEDNMSNPVNGSDDAQVRIIAAVGGEGSAGHLVWDDTDGDGIRDPDEPGIDGVSLDLLDASGTTVIQSTSTANGGEYVFNAPGGNYQIAVTDTAGILNDYSLTGGSNPHNFTMIADVFYFAANFGYSPPPAKPSISVSKSADTSFIEVSADVTFDIVVSNTGTVDTTLTTLFDTSFGNLDGEGSCATGAIISVGGSYSCSFSRTITNTGNAQHHNSVIALAKSSANLRALGVDSVRIDFAPIVLPPTPVPSLPQWALAILAALLSLLVWRQAGWRHRQG